MFGGRGRFWCSCVIILPLSLVCFLLDLLTCALASYCLKPGVVLDNSFLPYVTFKKITNSTVFYCVSSCMSFSICESINFDERDKTCFLNFAAEVPDIFVIEARGYSTYSAIENWPKRMAGVCEDHSCEKDEQCTESRANLPTCVPNAEYRMEYVIHQKKRTWNDAKTDCEQRHGNLAIFDTSEKYERVKNMIRSGGMSYDIWFGARNWNGKWKWVDESEVIFGSWVTKRLNEGANVCLRIRLDDPSVEWDDRSCGKGFYYICDQIQTV